MNNELVQLLREHGASTVGFAKIGHLYQEVDISGSQSEDSETETFDIPHYPIGVSILLAYPRQVIQSIREAPTLEYFDAYHSYNDKLDSLARLCADYIKAKGYEAYPQTTASIKEYGIFRTIMPHKTVAVNAGLGWIGKSALFVTKEFGSALRLTSVLTNAPLDYAKPLTSLRCGACRICTNACPGHAISGKEWTPTIDRDEFFDAMACRLKAREISANTLNKQITLCGKCIEVCPYTQNYIASTSTP